MESHFRVREPVLRRRFQVQVRGHGVAAEARRPVRDLVFYLVQVVVQVEEETDFSPVLGVEDNPLVEVEVEVEGVLDERCSPLVFFHHHPEEAVERVPADSVGIDVPDRY